VGCFHDQSQQSRKYVTTPVSHIAWQLYCYQLVLPCGSGSDYLVLIKMQNQQNGGQKTMRSPRQCVWHMMCVVCLIYCRIDNWVCLPYSYDAAVTVIIVTVFAVVCVMWRCVDVRRRYTRRPVMVTSRPVSCWLPPAPHLMSLTPRWSHSD